jgi:insulin receptor
MNLQIVCRCHSVHGRKKRRADAMTETGDHDNNHDNNVVEEFPEITINSSHNQAIGIVPGENHTNTYDNHRLVTFYQKVTGTSYTVVGVRHYAEYTIQVIACHDHDPVRNRSLCSLTAVTSARTKQSGKYLFFYLSFVCDYLVCNFDFVPFQILRMISLGV